MITGREFVYPLSDLVEKTRIGPHSLHQMLSKLKKQGTITEKNISGLDCYQLNQHNLKAKKLVALYDNKLKKKLKVKK